MVPLLNFGRWFGREYSNLGAGFHQQTELGHGRIAATGYDDACGLCGDEDREVVHGCVSSAAWMQYRILFCHFAIRRIT